MPENAYSIEFAPAAKRDLKKLQPIATGTHHVLANARRHDRIVIRKFAALLKKIIPLFPSVPHSFSESSAKYAQETIVYFQVFARFAGKHVRNEENRYRVCLSVPGRLI